MAETLELLESKIKAAKHAGARLVELRLDALRGSNYGEAIAMAKREGLLVVSTIRAMDEGGYFQGPEEERLEAIAAASRSSDYVDVEYSAAVENSWIIDTLRESEAKIIVSRHYFKDAPRDPENMCKQMLELGDIAKLVSAAESLREAASILSLYSSGIDAERIIAFCIGEKWKLSRLVSLMLGAPFTYASLEGEAVAPGQPSFRELAESLERLSEARHPCFSQL